MIIRKTDLSYFILKVIQFYSFLLNFLLFLGVFTLVKVYWTTVDLKAAFRMSEDEEKVKLRRIEPAIQKFIKVAIPTDLERLRKHQINIEKVSVHFLLM